MIELTLILFKYAFMDKISRKKCIYLNSISVVFSNNIIYIFQTNSGMIDYIYYI